MDSFHAPTLEPQSRRERNKIATRRAIGRAALSLMEELGYDCVTIDQVADRADVSRRTFFNYFSSLNDALHDHNTWIFEYAAELLQKQSPDLPVMDATLDVLHQVLQEDLLEKAAYLAIHGESIPSLQVTGLATWSQSVRFITPHLVAKYPEKDPFVIAVFAQAVLGACSAAFSDWAQKVTDQFSAEDVARLGKQLTRAMELVRDGFSELDANTEEGR